MSTKIFLILVAGALLLFYRFAFPWTPFWVDITVVVIGAVIALALSAWRVGQPRRKA